jgi:hypothetical protein
MRPIRFGTINDMILPFRTKKTSLATIECVGLSSTLFWCSHRTTLDFLTWTKIIGIFIKSLESKLSPRSQHYMRALQPKLSPFLCVHATAVGAR